MPAIPVSDTSLRRLFRLGLYLCVILIAVLAFSPLEEAPLTSYDKANHIIAFVMLAWLTDGAYPAPRYRAIRWALALLAYGLFIEVVQYHLPFRTFELLDLAADGTGILFYLVLARQLRPRFASGPPETGGAQDPIPVQIRGLRRASRGAGEGRQDAGLD